MNLNKNETKLGFSLYPSKEKIEESLKYIDLACKHSFSYLFLNMIGQIDGNNDQQFNMKICEYAKRKGLQVSLDVSINQILQKSPIDAKNLLRSLSKHGVFAIRVDDGIDGKAEEFILASNDELFVELNASTNTVALDYLLKKVSMHKKRIIASHNFYPQENTGLTENFLLEATKNYVQHGIENIGAFITLNDKENVKSVWKESNITPTLEKHRKLPLVTQFQHFLLLNDIKRVIISNQFASKTEFAMLEKLKKENLVLFVELETNISPLAKKIILNDPHCVRGDMAVGFIRSTQNRIVLKNVAIPANNALSTGYYSIGDVLLINENFGRYKGELQIVLQPNIKRTARKNIIARVIESNLFLLKFAQPWMKLKFFED